MDQHLADFVEREAARSFDAIFFVFRVCPDAKHTDVVSKAFRQDLAAMHAEALQRNEEREHPGSGVVFQMIEVRQEGSRQVF